MSIHKYPVILISAIIIFQGINIIIFPHKLSRYFGLFLIIMGAFILKRYALQSKSDLSNSQILSFIKNTTGISHNYFFYFTGAFFLIITLSLNSFYLNGYIGNLDVLIILTSFLVIGYPEVPKRYIKEYDFMFLFVLIVTIIVLLPRIYSIVFLSPLSSETKEFYDYLIGVFLARPLSNLLLFLGYDNYVSGNTLHLFSINEDYMIISIDVMCSGIYSVVVFVSAFFSFMILYYKKFDSFFFLLLICGVITSYIANLIRMFFVILAGYYGGENYLYFAHENLGWLIFIFWISIFWQILFYLISNNDKNRTEVIE